MHANAKSYTLPEARDQLPTMLQDALSGQEVCLEQGGEPVAVLLSMEEFNRLQGQPKQTPGAAIQQVRPAGPADAKAWRNAFADVGNSKF